MFRAFIAPIVALIVAIIAQVTGYQISDEAEMELVRLLSEIAAVLFAVAAGVTGIRAKDKVTGRKDL